MPTVCRSPARARCRRPSLLILCVLCLALLMSCGGGDRSSPGTTASETPRGSSAPHTALPMPPVSTAHRTNQSSAGRPTLASQQGWTLLDGRRAHPSDYAGKVLVLDFWATYCPPCREEVPHLIALQQHYGAQGLNVVGLNVGGDDDRPKVPAFMRQLGVSYPLGFPDPAMSDLVFSDNDAIPQTFVFDRQGRLLKRFVGYDGSVPAQLERAVQTALAE